MSTATPNPVATPARNTNDFTTYTIDLRQVLTSVAAENWGWLMAAGVLSTFAGLVALAAPVMATAVVGMIIVATIFTAGALNASAVFWGESGSTKLGATLVGVAQMLLATVMIVYPLPSIATLTIFIAAFLLVAGIARVSWAFATRSLPGWGWSLAGGLATMTVGLLALAALPGSALWVIGVLVGAEMFTTGVIRIAAAWRLRAVAKEAA